MNYEQTECLLDGVDNLIPILKGGHASRALLSANVYSVLSVATATSRGLLVDPGTEDALSRVKFKYIK